MYSIYFDYFHGVPNLYLWLNHTLDHNMQTKRHIERAESPSFAIDAIKPSIVIQISLLRNLRDYFSNITCFRRLLVGSHSTTGMSVSVRVRFHHGMVREEVRMVVKDAVIP